MKPSASDLASVVALLASGFALYQTREANSPRIVVTPVAERSFVACNSTKGRFESRSIIRFNVSNVGGRTATLERLEATRDIEPVSIKLSETQKPATDFLLGRIENLGQLPAGAASSKDELNPILASAKPVLVERDSYSKNDRGVPALLNIPIEAGKAVTLDFAVLVPTYEGSERVEGITLALLASFNHGESVVLRSSTETARIVARGGQCRQSVAN